MSDVVLMSTGYTLKMLFNLNKSSTRKRNMVYCCAYRMYPKSSNHADKKNEELLETVDGNSEC